MNIPKELKELVERLEKDKELYNYLEECIRELLYQDYVYSSQEECHIPYEWTIKPDWEE